jgi:hypothetical protein
VPHPLAIKQEGNVVPRDEEEPPHEPPEPPGDGPPGSEMDRQPAPSASRPCPGADGVQPLTQVNTRPPATIAGGRQQGPGDLPLLLRQIRQGAAPLEGCLPCTVFLAPSPPSAHSEQARHPARRILKQALRDAGTIEAAELCKVGKRSQIIGSIPDGPRPWIRRRIADPPEALIPLALCANRTTWHQYVPFVLGRRNCCRLRALIPPFIGATRQS